MLYGTEAWTMTTFDKLELGLFEKKVLRKILILYVLATANTAVEKRMSCTRYMATLT